MLINTGKTKYIEVGHRQSMLVSDYNTLGSNSHEKHWKWRTWHWKASAKNSIKLNKFLHSEVNLLIQHIIVQDQDRLNNILHLINQNVIHEDIKFILKAGNLSYYSVQKRLSSQLLSRKL